MRISHGRSGRPCDSSLRAREVPVRLQERLLGQVLGVVMVAHPVVRVRVDVLQVRLVERGEVGVELGLVRGCGHAASDTTSALRGSRLPLGLGGLRARSATAVQRSGSTLALDDPGQPVERPARRRRPACRRAASSGTAATASAVWPSAAPMSAAGMPCGEQLAGAAVARALGEHGRDEVAGAGEAGERARLGAVAAREGVDLGEDLAGGGARGVRAGGGWRRRRRARRRSWRSRRARRR